MSIKNKWIESPDEVRGIVSGRVELMSLQPGSLYEITVSHDAWVVENEPFITMEPLQDTMAKCAKPAD